MRLLVFADLHLDTAFTWAGQDAAQRRRQNLRDAFMRIMRTGEELAVDALLIAGDLYEQDRFTPDTGAFLRSALEAFSRPVYIAPGNHDWLGPTSLYAQLDWPTNVTIFTEAVLKPVDLDDGLTLWGAAHRAPANTDGFFDNGFRVDRSGVNLALFHGSEQSGMGWQQEGKAPHAPFKATQVEAAGLDHAFCGHYHRPREEARYTYPGAPDPLAFGDSQDGGAVEVEVQADGTVQRTWHRVRVSDVHDLTVDINGCASMQDVLDRAAGTIEGLSGCARMTLKGEVEPSLELDPSILTRDKRGLDALVVRANGVHFRYDFERLAAEPTVRGQFVRDVQSAADLADEDRERILVTGLRALDGRRDLEVS